MLPSISRRSFLKKNLLISIPSIAGYNLFRPFKGDFAYPVYSRIRNPIWLVKKELYVPSPEPRVAPLVSMCYKGSGLIREETRQKIRTSDWAEKPMKRVSSDNGNTWSEWEVMDEKAKLQGDCTMEGGASQEGTGPYDPVSHRRIKCVFQRIVKGDPKVAMSEIWKGNRLFCDHGFFQMSDNDGRSWGDAYMLKYEEGPDFDPDNWAEEKFYRTNEMYIGNIITIKNGSILICATVPVPFMDEGDRDIPSKFPNEYREGCVGGAMCFVGRWNESAKNYLWELSKPIFLPRRISTRGLDELHVTELVTDKIFMVIRGSNAGLDPLKCPGRRWFSVSDDGGLTWSEIRDIRFDTGEQLYSPSSISSTIRSTGNGKLYWIGNISGSLVEGNSPRYPLVIVEVDEEKISFKKDTLTVIDDRDPKHDSVSLQLSNFTVLENRETNDIEIYLTRLGEKGGGDEIWSAGAYKYTLKLVL